jgi:hypothetical protein
MCHLYYKYMCIVTVIQRVYITWLCLQIKQWLSLCQLECLNNGSNIGSTTVNRSKVAPMLNTIFAQKKNVGLAQWLI